MAHSKRRFREYILQTIVILSIPLFSFGCSSGISLRDSTTVHFTRALMGTQFKITLSSADTLNAHIAADSAFQVAHLLEEKFSDYDPNSELSRLSEFAGQDTLVPVSRDLFDVLHKARTVGEASQGAYDPTIGALTRLWRRGIRRQTLPDSVWVERASATVDYTALTLDSSGSAVSLGIPGMRLDLGGIAKGFTADRMMAVLNSAGFGTALVDAGGDIVAGQMPPGDRGWVVSIPEVDRSAAVVRVPVRITDLAIAMSGDTYRYLETDSLRFSHIIDPHSGYGLTHRRLVVTIADCGAIADALASALSVLHLADIPMVLQAYPGSGARIIQPVDGKYVQRDYGDWW
jgi:thiamine biosynthesis lipoprotein